MKNTNRIIQPFGQIAREIVIQADTKGLVRVNAYSITYVAGGVPAKIPMDAREMVLALIKVVQDYSTVIFASMGEGVMKHGEENKDHDNSGQPG